MKKNALCIEASHQMGMGHLYRMLNLIDEIVAAGDDYLLLVNDDAAAQKVLKDKQIKYKVVDLSSNFENTVISKYQIDVWINDRMATELAHAQRVAKVGVSLVTFDDLGRGAEYADINFGSLPYSFNKALKGKRVLTGLDYMILNKEIDQYKKQRFKLEKILVTLGGTDTYGVTLAVVKHLKNEKIGAKVLVGPGFRHQAQLKALVDETFEVVGAVDSLIKEYSLHDLAITGGGVTPFEANATGLPCVIIANEEREIENGQFLAKLGSSVFAGYYKEADYAFNFSALELGKMSKQGLTNIKTDGANNIYREICKL